MKALVREIDSNYYSFKEHRYKKEVLQQRYLEGESLDDIFRQFYEWERNLRYINCRYCKFDIDELNKQYLEWKETNETPQMFYGNSTYWD